MVSGYGGALQLARIWLSLDGPSDFFAPSPDVTRLGESTLGDLLELADISIYAFAQLLLGPKQAFAAL
jgi:hypothetical protein